MPKNEEGEFELILGNRQLLSVFFIVVILLGVFFTMGYIVGRNSTPGETAGTRPEPAVTSEPTPKTAETPKAAEPTPAETATQLPADEKGTEPPTAKPEPAKPAKAESTRPTKAETKAEAKKDKVAKGKTTASSEPVTGQTYLQLAATSKHEADIMVDVLRTKGFKSLASEIEEKRGTYRVLVGPIPEGGANKVRADLQASGFPGNAAIRRTF